MFVLVTQADGSARRFSWITYAIVAGLIAFYVQQQGAQQAAFVSAEQSRQEVLAYLDENEFLEVDERFGSVVPLRSVASRREAFFKERREQGLALMSEHLVRRSQREFDKLLEQALFDIQLLPKWRLGIRSKDAPSANWIMHFAVHETQLALILSIVWLLILGIALEDAWGPILFGCLASAGVLTTAFASGYFDYLGATGMPWIGTSGLIATLMGAYFVRSSPSAGAPRAFGMIPMPSWLLLPVWLTVEYAVNRGVSSPLEIVNATAGVHGVGLALGAFVSAVLMVLKVEDKSIDREQETKELVDNRVLEKAMLAREAGKIEQAFELLRKEYRRSPEDRDVALALWDVSTQLGKASRVVEAMMFVVENDLQTGNSQQAILNWFAMTEEVTKLTSHPQLFVRIGEALLDAGHAEEAIAAMTRAISGTKPLTTALAQRIVRIARDLDPELTRRAAEIALEDGQLGVVERADLDKLSDKLLPDTTPHQSDAPPKAARHSSVDANAETNFELGDPAERNSDRYENDDDISSLDPQALSIDELEEELAAGPGDIESQEKWNHPGQIEDLSDELVGAFDGLDAADLAEAALEAGILDDTVTVVNISRPNQDSETTITEVDLPSSDGDETTTAVNIEPAMRSLKIRSAVPLALEAEAIVIEVDGGNKTRLPYERIEALAAAAIQGLGEKPVVLIDLIVNWQAAGEPMKVIRMRSDRFDPAQLTEGAANQLEAFRTLLANLLRFSNAAPLPNFNAATGAPFQVFAGLEQYHLEVLGGTEDPDA